MLMKMSEVPTKELLLSSVLGLAVVGVVITLGYIYPAAQTALAIAAITGTGSGFLFCRHVYMKGLEDQ